MKLAIPDDSLILPVGLQPLETFAPLGTRIRILVDETRKQTEGGIMLPDKTADNRAFMTGKVEAVGPDVKEVKVGWRVAWGRTVTPELWTEPNDRLIVMDEEFIAARIVTG